MLKIFRVSKLYAFIPHFHHSSSKFLVDAIAIIHVYPYLYTLYHCLNKPHQYYTDKVQSHVLGETLPHSMPTNRYSRALVNFYPLSNSNLWYYMNHFARIRFIVAFYLFFEFILHGFLYFCQTFHTVTCLFETGIGTTVLWFENVYAGSF